MKKLLLVLLALTVLGVMAFADDVTWTYGATIKTGAQITLYSDSAIPTAARVYDNDDSVASRVRFDAEAALGDFSAHIRVGGDFAGTVDTNFAFLNAWWATGKFFDKMLEVRAGNIDNSVTDTVNNGWGGSSVEGMQFVVVPVSGLSIAYGLPLIAANGHFMTDVAMSKAGFAYSMPNLATVKFTYVNAPGDKLSNVYGGVRILAVPNLTADLEFQALDLGNKAVGAAGNIELFENAQYAMGAFAPGIVLDEVLYNDSAYKMQLYVKPYVDYTVSDSLMVGGNVKFTNNAGGTDKLQSLGIDPYVKMIFNSKATLKTDFAFGIADLTDTATWTMPININFMWSF